jgi:hypothetical protein
MNSTNGMMFTLDDGDDASSYADSFNNKMTFGKSTNSKSGGGYLRQIE